MPHGAAVMHMCFLYCSIIICVIIIIHFDFLILLIASPLQRLLPANSRGQPHGRAGHAQQHWTGLVPSEKS